MKIEIQNIKLDGRQLKVTAYYSIKDYPDEKQVDILIKQYIKIWWRPFGNYNPKEYNLTINGNRK